jgi:hypothetical protein
MSKPLDLVREAPPASEAPEVIYLPPPPANDPVPMRKNGRAISSKPGSQISRRRTVKDPRSARLQIRCTPQTQEKAEAASIAAGLSISGWVCSLIDGTPGPRVRRRVTLEIQELARMRAEQSKRGGNLNQCAKQLHIIGRLAGEGIGGDELKAMIAEMIELYRAAIAEVHATCGELDRALGLHPDDDY